MSDASSQGGVRTRFAPSPSGHLHVGGARTALFNWAFARHHGGTFILRIEDTDQKRSSGAASVGFLKDLKWLGIEWDEGPEFEGVGGGEFGSYFQSERLHIYTQHAEKLIAEGKAYRAFDTAEELDAARDAARKAGKNFRYTQQTIDAATMEKYRKEGRPSVVRFRLPESVAGGLKFHDEVLGDITTEPELIDDFVIIKADSYPTYHFAVVVDDALMRVTHVIRAQEHLNNTFKHILLQEALGFERPNYAHVSIIFNPDGSKMSKRDQAKAARKAIAERIAKGDNQSSLVAKAASVLSNAQDPLMRAIAEKWVDVPTKIELSNDEHLRAKMHVTGEHPPGYALGLQEAALRECQSFLDGANDNVVLAECFALVLDLQLPEINVDDFRKAGYLPGVLVNYLALLGWNPGGDVEKFDADFLIKHFSMDRIIKSPAKFDRAKLLAFNLDALQAMPPEVFVKALRAHGEEFHSEYMARFPGAQFDLFATCNQARSKTLEDPFRSCRFMIVADDEIVYEDSKPVRKAFSEGAGEPSGLLLLESVLPVLEAQRDWSPAALEAALKLFADAHAGGNIGKVAQPLRIAVSGGVVSPAIVETLSLIGRDAVLNRIRRCIAWRRATVDASP